MDWLTKMDCSFKAILTCNENINWIKNIIEKDYGKHVLKLWTKKKSEKKNEWKELLVYCTKLLNVNY